MIEDPITFEERASVATQCVADLDLPMPALIDGMDDTVNKTWKAGPDRLFLVGEDGRVAYTGGRGPFFFSPDEWADAIAAELARK